jgi:hypothetical protein
MKLWAAVYLRGLLSSLTICCNAVYIRLSVFLRFGKPYFVTHHIADQSNQTPLLYVRKQTIATELPPLVGEF